MNRVSAVMVFALLCLGGMAQADVFNLGAGFTNLETVAVGDPGNAADTRYTNPGMGAVDYNYNIGKYEVTAKQYTEFLNNKANVSDDYRLYNSLMWSESRGCMIQQTGIVGSYTYSVAADYANRPVNYVSFWDACRFANWLSNGQGNCDTETGSYTLTSGGIADHTIMRNAGAKWAVTSVHEWYKAAYYKGSGTNAGYWDYPTQSNSTPSNRITDPDGGNNANFYQNGYTIGSPYYRTNVGEFENSISSYGTFDQGGNVGEWTDSILDWTGHLSLRGVRGGYYGSDWLMRARGYGDSGLNPSDEGMWFGFRVSEVDPVPEPSSFIVLTGGLVSLLALRRRSGK